METENKKPKLTKSQRFWTGFVIVVGLIVLNCLTVLVMLKIMGVN